MDLGFDKLISSNNCTHQSFGPTYLPDIRQNLLKPKLKMSEVEQDFKHPRSWTMSVDWKPL